MNPLNSARFATWAGVLAVVATATAVALHMVAYNQNPDAVPSIQDAVFISLAGAVFGVVGAVIATKRPGNLIGWSLICGGLSMAMSYVGQGYASIALLADPGLGLPGGRAALSLTVGLWTGFMGSIFYLVVLFPRGRLPSRRWRALAIFTSAAFAFVYLFFVVWPSTYDPPFDDFTNVFGIQALDPITSVVYACITLPLLSIAVAVVNLFIRFRQSRGDEREQFRWLVGSAGILIAVNLLPSGGDSANVRLAGIDIIDVIATLGTLGVPIAIGFAVLKYRLYDIDRILNRTLSYGVLTALLGSVYVGLVLGLQELLRPLNGGSEPVLVTTTLIIAALFLPARRRVQQVVDRRFNRQHYDAERTVEAFAARLRQQIDLDTLRAELLTVLDDTMQPAAVSLWLRSSND